MVAGPTHPVVGQAKKNVERQSSPDSPAHSPCLSLEILPDWGERVSNATSRKGEAKGEGDG